MQIQAKKIDQDKRRSIGNDITKQLDRQENDRIPQCELSETILDIGPVRFMEEVTRTVTIRNTSLSSSLDDHVNFFFVPKPHSGSQEIGKSWLTVNPEWGVMGPGETATITVTVYVEAEASAFNLGREKLSDILILRLENGVDHYVSTTVYRQLLTWHQLEVRGQYVHSCVANYIDYLVRQPGPIRANSEPLPSGSPQILSVPKELWNLIDSLSRFPNQVS